MSADIDHDDEPLEDGVEPCAEWCPCSSCDPLGKLDVHREEERHELAVWRRNAAELARLDRCEADRASQRRAS